VWRVGQYSSWLWRKLPAGQLADIQGSGEFTRWGSSSTVLGYGEITIGDCGEFDQFGVNPWCREFSQFGIVESLTSLGTAGIFGSGQPVGNFGGLGSMESLTSSGTSGFLGAWRI